MLVFVEQPLTNAKAGASPKQRLILLRGAVFHFINLSFVLLVEFLFVIAANVAFANSLHWLLHRETENPSPDLVFAYLDICWCSPLDMGFIPSPLLVAQPLANAKTIISPKQRLILVRRLFLFFITVSFFC